MTVPLPQRSQGSHQRRRTCGHEGNTIQTMRWKYRRGYSGPNYHVTGGHEREARAAQRAKPPSRLGLFVLRLLGFREAPSAPRGRRRPSPNHEHRHKT